MINKLSDFPCFTLYCTCVCALLDLDGLLVKLSEGQVILSWSDLPCLISSQMPPSKGWGEIGGRIDGSRDSF